MAEETPQGFVPAVTPSRRGGGSWVLGALVIGAFVVFGIAYLLFSKPETVPATVLFEKLFPGGSAIGELERITIDIDGILQHPVFRSLKEQGPLPLEIPPLGKPNPFI